MKKLIVFRLVMLTAGTAFSQDLNSSFKLGFQACSDSFFGVIAKTGSIEAGLKAMVQLNDPADSADFLYAGASLAWLFNSKDGVSSFGTGVDFRNMFGAGYAEHVDMFLRLSYNYHLSKHFMLSGIFYPISFSTRETEDSSPSDWSSVATIPSAAVAVTVFF